MILTTIFLIVVAALIGWLLLRRRAWLLTLGLTYLLVSGAAGVILGLPLITNDVVDEDVVRVASVEPIAQEPAAEDGGAAGDAASQEQAQPAEPAQPAADPVPRAAAAGSFQDAVHPGAGQATIIDTGDGSTVLTLTEFETDNGPDLFVYLVPETTPAGSVDGFVDLGGLKGNLGDQQYDIPAGLDVTDGWRVVIWCRAFAVSFTEATLG